MQPQQVVYAQAPVQTSPQHKHGCAFKTLGILQIVVAGISVLLGSTNIAFTHSAVIAQPIWGGVLFYLPAGILCILVAVVSASSRKCLAIACMVMCIIAALAAGVNIILDGMAIGESRFFSRAYGVSLSFNCILLITAVAELVAACVASAYCCLILSQETSAPAIQYVVVAHPNAAMYDQAATAGYPTANQSFLVSQPAANTVNQGPLQYQAFGEGISEKQAFEKQAIVD